VSWLVAFYREEVLATGKQALFLLLVAFVLTFLSIRLSVRMIRAGVSWWPGNVSAGGVHLHHVVFGTVLMLVSGVLAFAPAGWESPWWDILGALFGIGAALVLDEFALILHLQDVYWSEKGRTSVDAVVLAAGVTGLLVLGALPFGLQDMAPAEQQGRWGYVLTVLVNASFVALALLKGRTWLGVLGLVVPLLALIGAVRLGRPQSPWARWRYRDGSRKHRVALRRADRHERRGERVKTRLFDAIAGRPDAPAAVVAVAEAVLPEQAARRADDTAGPTTVRAQRGG
jgi:lysyl-tRNA synthetase class 2